MNAEYCIYNNYIVSHGQTTFLCSNGEFEGSNIKQSDNMRLRVLHVTCTVQCTCIMINQLCTKKAKTVISNSGLDRGGNNMQHSSSSVRLCDR